MLDDLQKKELSELIDARWEGTLTEQQAARLRQWIYQDDDACRFYLDYMTLHGLLVLSHVDNAPPEALPVVTGCATPESGQTCAYTEKTESHVLGFFSDGIHAGLSFLTRTFVLTLILTLGLPCVLLLVLLIHISSEPVPELPIVKHQVTQGVTNRVATIERMHKCVWEEPREVVALGAPLPSGRRLRLRKGLAELAFTNGARVILEGPVTFDVVSEKQGYLHLGKLVGEMPEQAKGFTINTPTATIVDLGTEFGVSVDKKGVVESHVFVGKVEVETKSASGEPPPKVKLLHAGEAAKIERLPSGVIGVEVKRINLAPDQFVRRIPPERCKGLPEPKIVFAHRGDHDPKTEGWELIELANKKVAEEGTKSVGPMNDGGTAAWFIKDGSLRYGISYHITAKEGLNPKIVAKARTQGWVLRARIKALNKNVLSPEVACLCSYWGTDRDWTMRPVVQSDGTQSLHLAGVSSLGKNAVIKIPDSRDRYVDYEMRYHPKTNDADIYIDGKLVVTGYYSPRVSKSSLQFGVFTGTTCDMRVARVEWGILEP